MKQQVVLITGATAGIGRRTALDLARAGHRVFATGRREAALASLKAEAAGTSLETLVLDVTSAASIEAARAAILAATDGHGVDALVNNAGYGLIGPLEELTDAQVRAQFETNVFGLMAVTRAFLPAMRARGAGRVINVSSVGGRMTFPLMGAYNATKYAVESLSDALRVELKPFGVHVSLIEPGSIRTEFAEVSVGTVRVAPGSPYAPVLSRADDIKKQFDDMAVGPEVISRVIRRAIEDRAPLARYVAPFSGRVMLWFMSTMPTWLTDAVMGRAMGLTAARLRPSAA